MKQQNQQSLSKTTCEWLIANSYDPEELNHRGENGDTALMKATRIGNCSVVEELIGAGAEINSRNNDGNNALWFACFGNHYELINLLLEVKVNIDNQNDHGATVLMYAASSGKAEVVKLLLPHHPNLQLKNLDDYKAIYFANTVEVLRMLKDAGE